MSKAGLTIVWVLALFIAFQTISKTFAQEKLTVSGNFSQKKSFTCKTPLEDKLVTHSNFCEKVFSPQKEAVVKAVEKDNNKNDLSNTISYSFETAKHIPTPTPNVIKVASSITPEPTQQTPLNMLPADLAENLNSDLILELINQHRTKIGKASFVKDEALCQLAQARSSELHDELFVKGGLHSGLYNRNLPYWITENAKYGSNEAGTVVWWLNSPIHRSAIEGDYTYSCGACKGTKCAQLFTSYTPKYNISTVPSQVAVASN